MAFLPPEGDLTIGFAHAAYQLRDEFLTRGRSAKSFEVNTLDDLRERAAKALPSLIPHDGWRGREDRILMRNAYADFGVSVYGGLVAVWIVEREDGAYWDADWRTARSPRAQRWLSQIASRFDAMFGDYDCLGHMSNGEGVYTKRAA